MAGGKVELKSQLCIGKQSEIIYFLFFKTSWTLGVFLWFELWGFGIAHCLVGVKVGEEKFRLDIATTLGSEEGFFIFFIFIFKENFWGFFFSCWIE